MVLNKLAKQFFLPQDIEKAKKLKRQFKKDIGTSSPALGRSVLRKRINKSKAIEVKVLK